MSDNRDFKNKKAQSKQKRKRTVIVPAQFKILEESFQESQWPSKNEKGILSRKLKMNERFVNIWFQNRRARARREEDKAKNGGSDFDPHKKKRKALESCVHEVDMASIKEKYPVAPGEPVTEPVSAQGSQLAGSSTHSSLCSSSTNVSLKFNKLSPTEVGKPCRRVIIKSSGSPPIVRRRIRPGKLRRMTKNTPETKLDSLASGNGSFSPSSNATEEKPVLKLAMNSRVRPKPIPRFKWEMKHFMHRSKKIPFTSPVRASCKSPMLKDDQVISTCCLHHTSPLGSHVRRKLNSAISQTLSRSTSLPQESNGFVCSLGLADGRPNQMYQKGTTMQNLPTRSGYTSNVLQNSTTPLNKPTLFHAIMNMIAIAERGIISKDDAEFGQAVTDSLYGMQINGNTQLVYDPLDGLEFVKLP